MQARLGEPAAGERIFQIGGELADVLRHSALREGGEHPAPVDLARSPGARTGSRPRDWS